MLAHRCLGCGRSCHGVVVRLFPDEVEPVRTAAAELGVADPVVDDRLRQQDGACVFLGTDGLCRIHARFGFAHKPRLCRQYPLVHIRTEEGDRWGIDPGCYTWPQTAGEPATDHSADDLVAATIPLPQVGIELERAWLADPPTTVAGWALRLSPGRDLHRWRSRWVRTLQRMPLAELVSRPDAGRPLRDVLLPVVAASVGWSVGSPPPMPEGPTDAVAAETVRRFLYLRLAPRFPPPVVVEALLGGGLIRQWVDPADDRITSAWSRAVRAPVFLSRWHDAWQSAPE